jgi:hypothetical protein
MFPLGGCGVDDLDPNFVAFLDQEARLPPCAAGVGHLQEAQADGRAGRSLAIEFPVSTSCAEQWWKSLERDARFKCEHGTEYRACIRGKVVPGQEHLFVMPREKDVLVVWKAGEGPVMFGPRYV